MILSSQEGGRDGFQAWEALGSLDDDLLGSLLKVVLRLDRLMFCWKGL